ncbi:MAG: Sinorhizobium phage phiM12 [Bacteroidota bacterium]|jgi:hypothetical protein
MKIDIKKFPKSGEKRRISVQIDNFDTWNLDHTLAVIILPALLQLKAIKHGIPNEFAEVGGANYDSQDSFDFYKETHNEAFEEGCKRWEEVLDKMIWSFQQLAVDDYDSQYHHGNTEYDWVKTDKKFPNPVTGKVEDTYQMVDKHPDQRWYDHIGHRLHEDRIQEGLELFGKYYRALWD